MNCRITITQSFLKGTTTMNNDIIKSGKAERISIFAMLWVIAGIYGFIYELIFYYFNSGMKYIYWRGGHFTPWILVYSFGGLLIYAVTFKFTKHPSLVCIFGGLGCGVLEYATGAALFHLCNGFRPWDYNTERWNFGNIGGFICLRSVVVFGLSSLLLMYVIYPLIIKMKNAMGLRPFIILTAALVIVFSADQIYNTFIAPNFSGLITADEFYTKAGLHI